jgi:hypothetical protein
VRAKVLVDGERPKVRPAELRKILANAGFDEGGGRADIGVVVGGDGRFSKYGRSEDIPLLFVGVRSSSATGSKAHLAGTTFDKLPQALHEILSGNYKVVPHRRLAVRKNGSTIGEVFTDVYLQRGSMSSCVRYKVKVRGEGVDFQDSAIGDGVVIATSAGATGYYSYLDRIRGDSMDPHRFATIEPGRVGICHIAPTYTEREGTGEHPLRYTVPWGSTIELSIFREADARLYGTTGVRAGVRFRLDDVVAILPGRGATMVISINDTRLRA